jgi:hypothetical protein
MNTLENATIKAIRSSQAACDYELLLRRIMAADMSASSCLPHSAEQEAWTDRVIALNDDAQETCTLLLAALVEQGVPAESECGEGGNFAIYYMGDGFAATLAGFALPTSITGVVQ